jgi:hypothetical protein
MAMAFLLAEGLAQLKWVWLTSDRPLYDLALIDGASRGAMGAFSLLWQRPGLWQAIGCVLFLLKSLVGPFTQQVLQYQTCRVVHGGASAYIPRTVIFVGQGAFESLKDRAMTKDEQIAVDSGVYSVNPVSVVCSTGNCVFEPYVSLGYYSSCLDHSVYMETETVNETYPSMIQQPGSSQYKNETRRTMTTRSFFRTNTKDPSRDFGLRVAIDGVPVNSTNERS